jgi:hypothetical protein
MEKIKTDNGKRVKVLMVYQATIPECSVFISDSVEHESYNKLESEKKFCDEVSYTFYECKKFSITIDILDDKDIILLQRKLKQRDSVIEIEGIVNGIENLPQSSTENKVIVSIDL